MSKLKTAKKAKFIGDEVSNAIIARYGDVVRSGTEVLDNINSLKVFSISPSLDIALGGGIREGTLALMTGDQKSGKAGSLTSTVYTIDGPKLMKDIVVGDYVPTPNGEYARVNGVFPQGCIDTYKVIFDDNTFTECSLDHLWKVRKNNHRSRHKDWQVLTLKEILASGLHYSDKLKWNIPLTKPVLFSKKNQPLDPWILGALLGDGGLTEGTPVITSADSEILERFRSYFATMNLNVTHKDRYSYSISNVNNGVGDNNLTNILRRLGLFGFSSHDKFIPPQYKYGSIEQRWELVRGLMDTDGYNDHGINAEYTTVSPRLCDDMAELVRSLGYKVKVVPRTTKCGGKEFASFRLHISGDNVNLLFALSRKVYDRKRVKLPLMKKIKDVIYIGKRGCQCISIDHPDHLYLADDFNVTHNTTTALHFAAKCQKQGKKVVYINTEGRLARQNFVGIRGLDVEAIIIVESTEDRTLSAEDFLNIIEYYVNNEPGCVIIVDSFSNMVPTCELEGEVRTGVRNALPRLLSMFCKRISGTLMKNKVIMIGITHNIANTGGGPYSPSKMADCGNMIQYQAGVNMVITHRGKWQVPKDSGPHVGQVANWVIKTSNAGGKPNTTAESWIRYGIGIDEVQEVIQAACEFSLIKLAGAWYTIVCAQSELDHPVVKKYLESVGASKDEEIEKALKFQGGNALCDFLTENKDMTDFIYSKIKELLVE